MLVNIIPPQNLELIRDAIGRVITAEINNQNVLIGQWNTDHEDDEGFVAKETISVNIFLERYQNIDKSELPAINIVYVESQQIAEQNAFTTLFDNKYLIEVYTNSPSNPNGTGDVNAAKMLATILGKVRAILMNKQYLYLDFTTKFIQTRKVQTITRTQPRLATDAVNTISGALELHYNAIESTELGTGIPIGELETVVKISETDKGYKYLIEKST